MSVGGAGAASKEDRSDSAGKGSPERVTVVIPLYEKAAFILRALRSVRAQTSPPDEILVVDDASTDGGGRVADSLGDPRVRVLRLPANRGPGAARNEGIRAARGDWIAFLDADDEWKPTFLARVLQVARDLPGREVGILTARSFREGLGVSTPVARSSAPWRYLDSFCDESRDAYPVNSSTAVVPRRVLEEVGGFNELQRSREDIDLWIRIGLRYPIIVINEVLTIVHADAPGRLTGRRQPRSPLIDVESICRHFGCEVDAIPSAPEREYCVRALYRHALGMLRWGLLEEFDRTVARSRFDLRRRTVLRWARRLRFAIPRRRAESGGWQP